MFTKITESFSRFFSSLSSPTKAPVTDQAPANPPAQSPGWDNSDRLEVQGPKIKRPTGGTAQGPSQDGDQFVQGPKVKRPTGLTEEVDDLKIVQGPKVKRPTGLVDTPELDDDIKLA